MLQFDVSECKSYPMKIIAEVLLHLVKAKKYIMYNVHYIIGTDIHSKAIFNNIYTIPYYETQV